MNISKHLDKDNLHHAYLIEGARDEVMPEVLAFWENSGIKTSGNPDFCQISVDNFKIDEAFNLRSFGSEKSFSSGLSAQAGKKIFIISANHFSLDAQGVLLRMFEEPIENTHFFLIVPSADALLKTLISRFYFISARQNSAEELKDAEKFISLPLRGRIDFLKELLAEEEEDEETEMLPQNSSRTKALKFLNALEKTLADRALASFQIESKALSQTDFFYHFFKVREFLRQPGSSAKTLMESVAFTVPKF